jgi:hypothetical protein
MNIVAKLNGFLGRFVGPNAAHVIDGMIGVAIVGAVTFVESPSARVFLVHHALLSTLVTAGIPVSTALASKFRKAAGSSQPLVDELAQVIRDELAASKPAATPTVTTT